MDYVKNLKLRIIVFVPLFILGCATYQGKVQQARQHIKSQEFEAAKAQLQPLAQEEGGDQLIYLLDYATTLQIAGDFKISNDFFFKAEKVADEKDYHSISRVTGSYLLSEEVKQYKGDTFEKIFINAFLAMNFLELGDLDAALVEARRINDKYKLYQSEEKKNFELNSFAKYLSAMIWEADKKYDDAFIAYKEAYQLDYQIENIKEDLLRISKKSKRLDEYKKYKEEFILSEENKDWYDKNKAELVLIFQQGWGPQKVFNPADSRFPILRPTFSDTQKAKVTIKKNDSVEIVKKTNKIYDVESAAIQTLKDDQASLLARRVGAFIAKEVAANEISRRDKTLGALAWLVMHASERADLRQWSTLPESIQVVRFYLEPGVYDIEVQGISSFDNPTQDFKTFKEINLLKGKTKFLNWRSLH
ncbi:MAG: hypothetical protein L6Q37_14440 [Bdellovibrionaceae bacterium]|nr:hypothetical protein [Pseudobdellovibrionaceae bacterium]NUM57694.1 hypothetical protein [Pseudobdellovibrionaceae bacterium]